MSRYSLLPAFTLIELTIVLGVMAIIGAIGLPVGLSSLRYYSVNSENTALVGLLENVRSQAMVDTDERPHGLAITATDYVLFTGSSYATRYTVRDISYPRAKSITITGSTEVVFAPLTGLTTATTFTLQSATTQQTVTINKEGAITW